ncbi:conjugal transfer protein TraD [Acinetobacter baumannii]|uniref:conjugal transfer protein TraD n=1 Tax=Acinetobacter baumannii TaxID=470 RepID=UPI001D18C9AE|nr:conjugal transfer protein TraD [Acinetobacter baumannii]
MPFFGQLDKITDFVGFARTLQRFIYSWFVSQIIIVICYLSFADRNDWYKSVYEKKLLASLKKEAQAAQAKDRKKREHKLISIGALFEMVDFPTEDKGIITGLLLDAMEKAKSNNGLFQQFKISGDKFITEREQSRKAKSTVVDNSQ